MEEQLLTVRQTAQHFNLTTGLVYAAVAQGELPAIRFRPRGRIRVREADVRDWIEGHASGVPASRGVANRHPADPMQEADIERFLPPPGSRRFA